MTIKKSKKRAGDFGPGPEQDLVGLLCFFDENPLAGYHYPACGLRFDFHRLWFLRVHVLMMEGRIKR
jgi:hypothetical protein